jgi:hypothetical protein
VLQLVSNRAPGGGHWVAVECVMGSPNQSQGVVP